MCAAKRRIRFILADCLAWLREDWLDIKRLARSAHAAVRGTPAAAARLLRSSGRGCTRFARAAAQTLHACRAAAKRRTSSFLRGLANWLREDWLDIKRLARLALAAAPGMPGAAAGLLRTSWRGCTRCVRAAAQTLDARRATAKLRTRSFLRGLANWLREDWLDVNRLVRQALAAASDTPRAAAALLRSSGRGCARSVRAAGWTLDACCAAAKLRTRSFLRGLANRLREDWLDVKRLARLALAPASGMSGAAAGLLRSSGRGCARSVRAAARALDACRAAATLRTRSFRRGLANWLREDWLDVKRLARQALAAASGTPRAAAGLLRSSGRGCARSVRAAARTLDARRAAATLRTRSFLRGLANWLREDWLDIKRLAGLACLAACRLPQSLRSRRQAGRPSLAGSNAEDAPGLERPCNGSMSSQRAIAPTGLGLVVSSGRAIAATPALLLAPPRAAWAHAAGALRPAARNAQNRPTSGSPVSLSYALHRKRSDIRYWRNRTIRFLSSYMCDTTAQEHALNVCVFLFGILIAAGGYTAIQYYSKSRAQSDFERPGKEVVGFLTDTIERHVAVLDAARRQFTAKRTPPNRWKFFQFTRESLKSLPGIQALEWVPHVRAKYRKRYEKRAIKDGLFGFRFFGLDDSRLSPPKEGHFPIYYVEPYPGNEQALGFDLAADPGALEALRQARDTGKPVTRAFSSVDIKGSAGNSAAPVPGIAIVFPVYNTEILPFTKAERRKRITGFIRGVMRLDSMMQAYRSNLSVPPGLEVAFYSHEKGGGRQLRYHNPPLPAKTAPLPYPTKDKTEDINLTASFRIVDQDWSMVLRPESRLFLRNLSSAAWGFVIFAFLTTAIMLLYLVTTQTRTRAVERSVAERTSELEAEIAQRKRIEVELRKAKDDAVDANHAKSEFLAIMSHELRTPLNAISGFSEVMSGEIYGALGHKNYGDYASFIYDSANHLLSLINDILDLSKIEAERYEIHKEVTSLGEAWRPVEEMLGEQIAGAQLTLVDRLSNSTINIRADDRALRQIFLNLLSNAVKFTPEGGQIEAWAEIDPTGALIISVRDTGIGISKEDLELVFEPFKQVESKVARKHKGTGLGLPLTQRLVALHGGKVLIESEIGQGTTVRIVLEPDAVVQDGASDAGFQRAKWGRAGGPSMEIEQAKPATARFVDEDINREIRIYAKG